MSAADSGGPQPTAHDSGGMTRRELFRRGGTIGAGAAATVTVGSRTVPRFSPVGRAAAVAPVVAIGVLAGAAAVAYIGNTAAKKYLGDDRDYSGYTGADALHQEIAVGATEMQSADERVMTGIENNIQNSRNVALAKGKKAIIEKMNSGATEEEANTAMQEAIDGYFATIQKNLLTHYKAQASQIQHHYEQADTHDNLTAGGSGGIFLVAAESDSGPSHLEVGSSTGDMHTTGSAFITAGGTNSSNYSETSLELIDGSTVEAVPVSETSSYYLGPYQYKSGLGESERLGVDDPDGNPIMYFDVARYRSAWQSILNERDQVNADLSGFVTDVYSYYEPGEIPTDELVDPITAATELRQNYDNAAGQSAHAAMLGIPTTAELSAKLKIQSNEAEDGHWDVKADLFTAHVPRNDVTDSTSISSGVVTISTQPVSGATYTLTTTAGETIDISASSFSDNGDGTWSYDASGDLSTTSTSVDTMLGEEIGFKTGNTYYPSEWSDPFFIAYNYTDSYGNEKGEFTQIESEFTIKSVTDSDGNPVESFKPETRNNQTADVASLKEELEQLRKEQLELQEEAQEQDSSGGDLFGGMFSVGGNSSVVGLAVIGVTVFGILAAATDYIPFFGSN